MVEDPDTELFRRASRGDADAQVALSQAALAQSELTQLQRFTVAEIFARQAASYPCVTGFRQLAGVLLMQADYLLRCGDRDYAAAKAGHALAILDHLADADTEEATSLIEWMLAAAEADGVRERAIEIAKGMAGVDLAFA